MTRNVLLLASMTFRRHWVRTLTGVLLLECIIITLLLFIQFKLPTGAADRAEVVASALRSTAWTIGCLMALYFGAMETATERKERTLTMLLVRPVTAGEILGGQLLGCWALAGLAMPLPWLVSHALHLILGSGWIGRQDIQYLGLLFGIGAFAACAMAFAMLIRPLFAMVGLLFVQASTMPNVFELLRQSEIGQPWLGMLQGLAYGIYYLLPSDSVFSDRLSSPPPGSDLWGRLGVAAAYGVASVVVYWAVATGLFGWKRRWLSGDD